MEELIIGIVCSAITEGAKKFGRSPKAVILGLSVLCAIIYYVIEAVNPDLITFSWHHIVAVYGVSQVAYNYGIKLFGGKAETEEILYPTPTSYNPPVPEVINPSAPVEPVDTGEVYKAENVAKNEELTKRILIKKRLRPSVGLGTPTTNLPPSQ